MKRKINVVEQEEHESEHEQSKSSGDESEDEEPIIKDVLTHLSRVVPEKRASDLLYNGQLLRNKRTIPVTNITELVEYGYSLITMKLPSLMR